MFSIGLCSTFQMYMPGVGQRLGQRPTWDKMKASLTRGDLNALTDAYRKQLHDLKRTRRWRERLAVFYTPSRRSRQPMAEMELRPDSESEDGM